MISYTVHLPDPRRRDAIVLEKAEFVPDAFAKAALVFGGFWLLYHRLWVALALYVAALAAMLGLGVWLRLDPAINLGLSSLFHLFLGLEGNNLRRSALERSGFPAIEVVTAKKREEAEAKFFTLAGNQRLQSMQGHASAQGLRPAQASVLGMFPEPGGRS